MIRVTQSYPPLTRREVRTLTRYYRPAEGRPRDRDIAAEYGVTRSAITMRRLRGLAKLRQSSDPAVRRLAEAMRGRSGQRRHVQPASLPLLENV